MAYLREEQAAAAAAPLSARKALLVAMLVDAYVDRLFRAAADSGDILEFRAEMAANSPALQLILALCAIKPAGPTLVTEPMQVPAPVHGQLPVEDFMVSLYNDFAVPRLLIALSDGSRAEAHDVLAAAIDHLAACSGRFGAVDAAKDLEQV